MTPLTPTPRSFAGARCYGAHGGHVPQGPLGSSSKLRQVTHHGTWPLLVHTGTQGSPTPPGARHTLRELPSPPAPGRGAGPFPAAPWGPCCPRCWRYCQLRTGPRWRRWVWGPGRAATGTQGPPRGRTMPPRRDGRDKRSWKGRGPERGREGGTGPPDSPLTEISISCTSLNGSGLGRSPGTVPGAKTTATGTVSCN